MLVNIEIKARMREVVRQRAVVERISDDSRQVLEQDDTFFEVPRGRLKLRQESDQSAQLVQYQRDDTPGPKGCEYSIVHVNDADAIKEIFNEVFGVRGVV